MVPKYDYMVENLKNELGVNLNVPYVTLNFQFGFKALSHIPWLKVNIPMRTHLLLEPAEKPGSSEKLFKLYEEWVRKFIWDFFPIFILVFLQF